MSDVLVREATFDDAAELAGRLREADTAELWAASRTLPNEGLRRAVALSTQAWSGFGDGELVVMFGVGSINFAGGIGAPWLLGSDGVERHAVAFLRNSRPHLAMMRESYGELRNYVDARNRAAVRWLGWLGFTIHPAEPHGPFKMPFHKFEMIGASHV